MKALSIILIAFCTIACGNDAADVDRSAGEVEDLSAEARKVFWGSCDLEADEDEPRKVCREWFGEYFRNRNVELSCTSQGGTFWIDQKCPRESFLGACSENPDNKAEVISFYYINEWDEGRAKSRCQNKIKKSRWLQVDDLQNFTWRNTNR